MFLRLVKRFKSSIILALISILFYFCWKGYASEFVLMLIELSVGIDVDKAMEIACNNANIIGYTFLIIFILSVILTVITIIKNIFMPKVEDDSDE